MIITIDGPAGSGKSTVARKLAARLGIAYLDTGAMYRAVAWAALEQGIDPANAEAITHIASTMDLHLDCGPTHTRVRVGDHDISEAIRTMRVTAATPFVAKVQAVRDELVRRQRLLANELGACVSEGRDQGSVVFPEASTRIVLEATLEKRADRRYQELSYDGEEVSLHDVRENLRKRDAIDSKQWESLLSDNNVQVIDTTGLTITEVVDKLVTIAERNRA